MPTLFTRSRLLPFALVALVACGGGGDGPTTPTPTPPPTPAPTPTASIALAAPTATVAAGGSTTLGVTLTRGGGFTGPVTVAATALPAGVTVAEQVIAAGSTTATLTIAAASTAAAGTTTLTVTGTGTGVTIASQSLALTVTASAPITAIGTEINVTTGATVAFNQDGTRMAVGSWGEGTGVTRVFQRSGDTWVRLGGDIVGEVAAGRAGYALAFNAAGTRLAVGAYLDNAGGSAAGKVRVFDFAGGAWTQVGNTLVGGLSDQLGWTVALSGDGARLVAGAPEANNTNGRVLAWQLTGSTWTAMTMPTAPTGVEFGDAVAISRDGARMAVGAPNASGNTLPGSIFVYQWSGTAWTALGTVIQGKAAGDNAGSAVALSADGARLAIASPNNREGGVSGGGSAAGQVRVFQWSGSAWTQLGNDMNGAAGLNGDGLGESLGLSDDGTRLIASGASQGIARVFRLTGTTWAQLGTPLTGTAPRVERVAIAGDGRTVAIGMANATPNRVRTFAVAP